MGDKTENQKEGPAEAERNPAMGGHPAQGLAARRGEGTQGPHTSRLSLERVVGLLQHPPVVPPGRPSVCAQDRAPLVLTPQQGKLSLPHPK